MDRSSWSVAYFLPMPLHIDTGADKANDERIAKQVMGKEVNHLTKLKANNKINRHLDTHRMTLTFLGNCYCYPQINWEIFKVIPVFVQCVEKLADALTKPNIHR